jgi:hypothetical protein
MNWRDEFVKALATREMMQPTDLPPFGAQIFTTSGHTAEVVRWFGPAKDRAVPFADQRVVFALIFQDSLPLAGMSPGFFPEQMILCHESRKIPRFAGWMIQAILKLALDAEGQPVFDGKYMQVPTTSTKFN